MFWYVPLIVVLIVLIVLQIASYWVEFKNVKRKKIIFYTLIVLGITVIVLALISTFLSARVCG